MSTSSTTDPAERIALSVNLNKIALIRNSRPGNYPDVAKHGERCIELGVQGLTVHPRPDQRHIRPSDVLALGKLCAAQSQVEFNIEGNPFAPARGDYPGLLKLVEQAAAEQCTLVPDSDAQATSDHGFDMTQDAERLRPIIDRLHEIGVRVSLFMDPVPEQIQLAREAGADRIELYTGPFALAFSDAEQRQPVFAQFAKAAEFAHQQGLGINAGHDLNLDNMGLFKTLPHLAEVSIGHALTVEAIELGLPETIRRYLEICAR